MNDRISNEQAIEEWAEYRRSAPPPSAVADRVMARIESVPIRTHNVRSTWLRMGFQITTTAAALAFCVARLVGLLIPIATAS